MQVKKSDRGRKALALIVEASGVSESAAIKVLAALASSGQQADALEYASGLFDETVHQGDTHAASLQAAVDAGSAELGLDKASEPEKVFEETPESSETVEVHNPE